MADRGQALPGQATDVAVEGPWPRSWAGIGIPECTGWVVPHCGCFLWGAARWAVWRVGPGPAELFLFPGPQLGRRLKPSKPDKSAEVHNPRSRLGLADKLPGLGRRLEN